jgi:hypothetical protein
MKRIIIVGAKPNAKIPEGDVAYCANAAIGYHAEKLAGIKKIINVVSGRGHALVSVLRREVGPNRKLYQEKHDLILKARPEKIVLVKPDNETEILLKLRNSGYVVPIVTISAFERRLLIQKISGCSDPMISKEFFQIPFEQQLRGLRSLFNTIKQRVTDKEVECKSAFRPSTGIFSAIYAIHENGENAEYIISGIGIRSRNQYPSGKMEKLRFLPPHLFPDIKVLCALAKRYHISTTEVELEKCLPIAKL